MTLSGSSPFLQEGRQLQAMLISVHRVHYRHAARERRPTGWAPSPSCASTTSQGDWAPICLLLTARSVSDSDTVPLTPPWGVSCDSFVVPCWAPLHHPPGCARDGVVSQGAVTLMVVVLRSSYLHSHSRQYASTSFPGTGMGSTTCRQLLQHKETETSNRTR